MAPDTEQPPGDIDPPSKRVGATQYLITLTGSRVALSPRATPYSPPHSMMLVRFPESGCLDYSAQAAGRR